MADDKELNRAGLPATNYYWRWLTQVSYQIVSFGRDQIVGLILAVLILLYQLKEGLIKSPELHANELATLAYPYLTLLALYVGYEIVRAPFVIDRGQRKLIDGLSRDLLDRTSEKESQPVQTGLPDPILEAEVSPGSAWGPKGGPGNGTFFRAHISVRNVGSARTILKDWALIVPSRGLHIGVNPPEVEFIGDIERLREQIAHRKKAIDPGDAIEFDLTFILPIPRSQLGNLATEIQFRDVKNNWHTIPWTFSV